MRNNIKYFPRGKERRDRINLNKCRVPCKVSLRWLQFPKIADSYSDGDYMVVDVMTIGLDDSERKICELVLTKQDLTRMLEKIESKKR